LAAAVDRSKFPEIGTIAGDDTVLIITPNKKSRESLQRRIEALLK
jgi:arginine repressor